MALARTSLIKLFRPLITASQVRMGSEYGSGAGSGGGTGGSIRDAGGAFGKMEAAHEEQYFRALQAEQLKALKKHHDEEIEAHEREIRRHEDAIHRLRKRRDDIHKDQKDGSDSD